MTIGVGEPTFVDTNTLVFAGAISAPLHAAARRALRDLRRAGGPLWISRQVLREYLATLSRPQFFSAPRPVHLLIADVRRFERRFMIAEDGSLVTSRLLALLQQFPTGGRQVHDANIVATMQAHGIRRLLTDNTTDFARYAGVITVVPLASFR